MFGRNLLERSALLFILGACGGATAHGEKLIERQENCDDVLRRAALIAHVRIAGELPRAEEAKGERVWLAEVHDAAYGAETGQLVLVGQRPESGDEVRDFAHGESLILLASRDASGVFHPLGAGFGRWMIDDQQQLGEHPLRERLPPIASTGKPSDAIAWLWNEVRQLDFRIAIALNERDVADYARRSPLRLTISIDNVGGRELAFNNHIDFEYVYRGDPFERFVEKMEASPASVKVYAQALSDEHILVQLARELHAQREFQVKPGESAAAEFDLAEEHMLYSGMRYQVWAELGSRRSATVVFQLPGDEEPAEAIEKLAEREDEEGPFKMIDGQEREAFTMPMVKQTDEAAAIETAIALRLSELKEENDRQQKQSDTPEVVFLASAHVPPDFRAEVAGYRIVLAEPIDISGVPRTLKLKSGSAIYRGQALRVESVEVAKQTARVRLREVTQRASGTAAEVPLRLEQGSWRRGGETELMQN